MPQPPLLGTLPDLDRSTMVERLTGALIDAVVAGRFPPASPLPPERELAESLQVNRATLRQAVARLEQIGLLRRRHGSGTIVQDPHTLTAPEVVARIATGQPTELVRDLLEVREALAGVIGRRARSGLDAHRVADLRAIVDRIEAADSASERQLLELSFFGVLVDAAGNLAIASMLRWVEDVYGKLSAPSFVEAFSDPSPVLDGLRSLLATIAAGEDLESALTHYARLSGQRLLAAAQAPGRRTRSSNDS